MRLAQTRPLFHLVRTPQQHVCKESEMPMEEEEKVAGEGEEEEDEEEESDSEYDDPEDYVDDVSDEGKQPLKHSHAQEPTLTQNIHF